MKSRSLLKMASMKQNRMSHGICTMGPGFLYVIGGLHQNNVGQRIALASCERYDVL